MQPFNAPISDRKRQKFGVYMSRYEKESTMRPFDASISSYRRELFGEVMPRYETEPSMRPFDAPISDWKRELFGTYMRRYEEEPSMSAFDAPISDRRRELYGEYRQRWSSLKVGSQAYKSSMPANGLNWVTVGPWSVGGDGDMEPTIYDIGIYQVYMFYVGWAGVASWRMLIDGVKVYPFQVDEVVDNGNTMYLGTLSTTVRTGEVCTIQFKSDNAADGAGVNMALTRVFYGEFRG